MDYIKEAFSRVKEDIYSLGNELEKVKLGLAELKSEIKILTQFADDLRIKMMNFEENAKNDNLKLSKMQKNSNFDQFITQETPQKTPENTPTDKEINQTTRQINPTLEDIPTDKLLSQVLKRQNLQVSIRNEGVPTDKQTDRQTDRHMIKQAKNEEKQPLDIPLAPIQAQESIDKKDINHLEKVSEILSNLDSLKKDIRRKFKALTTQEIAVFSAIYSLEEQNSVDYKLLASILKLSESSIRDYIGKIQRKGIPIIKEKLNNKLVVLKISPELKKIASLDTIIKLREL